MSTKILSFATFKELFRLSLPMVVSQGAFAVMIFTDRFFMSYLDAAHIAASLGGGVAAFFCMSLFIGLISYANALVAQYFGAGEFAKCPRVVTQACFLALGSMPFLILAAYYGGKAFSLLGHQDEQAELEQVYFYVLMGGSFFALLKAALACYFSGIGRTPVVMVADLLGTALNIPLSWVLIFGKFGLPELGIAGAGLGTIIASLFSLGIFLYFYLSAEHQRQFHVRSSWHFDRGIMRRYLRLGIPSGLELFMNIGTFNLFLLLFQSYGVIEGAAMTIVFNWDMLSFIPLTGLNIGVMSLIGRHVGRGDMRQTSEVISSGFILALGYSAVLAVVFLVYRNTLVSVFDTGEANFVEIKVLANYMMLGLVTYMLADAVIIISGAVLRGAGDTRWIMLTSTSVHLVMLILQYFVIVVYEFPPLVSWSVFVAMLLSLAALYLFRLLGGTWRQTQRLARMMAD